MPYKIIICALVGGLIGEAAYGQTAGTSVLNTAGGTIEGSKGQYSHSFSVGEVVISTISGNDDQATQGYLQPEALPAPDGFDYYPNPVDDKLFLVNAQKVSRVKIYDVNGRLIFSGAYTGKPIVLEELSGGTYLVNTLSRTNKILHKFAIIKQ